MTIYTVHLPPDAAEPRQVAERARFVKEGFAFFGFVFTGLWLLLQGLWLHALAYFAASLGVTGAVVALGLPPLVIGGIGFLLSILVGLEGNEWIRRSLARRGWRQAGTVSGPSLDECERRFFQDWTAARAWAGGAWAGRAGGAGQPSPGGGSGAPPPLPMPAAAAPTGVLGVFPRARSAAGERA